MDYTQEKLFCMSDLVKKIRTQVNSMMIQLPLIHILALIDGMELYSQFPCTCDDCLKLDRSISTLTLTCFKDREYEKLVTS